MIGSLALPPATFLRFSRGNACCLAGSHRKMSIDGRISCKAAVHAVAGTAMPVGCARPANLYEVLGVERNASTTEIKTAYRSMAKLYHPDASSSRESDGRDFIDIHDAYATLSDPTARTIYDLSLSRRSERRPFGYWIDESGYGCGFYPTRRWETDQCW